MAGGHLHWLREDREVGEILGDWGVEVDPAGLGEPHNRCGGDLICDAGHVRLGWLMKNLREHLLSATR
jgi:hypothetical protein